MSAPTLWPARLHHLRRDTAEPERLARFYADLLGDRVERLSKDEWLVSGAGRMLVVGVGTPRAVPYTAFMLPDAARLAALAAALTRVGVEVEASPTPLFAEGAFAVRDPDGTRVVFGVPRSRAMPMPVARPGRLQHVVCATSRLPEMLGFYRDTLGMRESDRVIGEDDALTAVFLRSDPEHHSFAAFRAPVSGADHHCYETPGWMAIRDWADHVSVLRIPIFWGPGRHGPGNNLFVMIEDPDGHKVEFSAELELMPYDMAHRTWPHEERTLNLWGTAWMRS